MGIDTKLLFDLPFLGYRRYRNSDTQREKIIAEKYFSPRFRHFNFRIKYLDHKKGYIKLIVELYFKVLYPRVR